MSAAMRWAHGVVVDWTLHVTRGLPKRIGDDRFQQIVSDLWEQEHASRPGPALAGSLLVRALRGVPADLAWRREVLRETPRAAVVTEASAPLRATGRPFDQTNGAVDMDGGELLEDELDPDRLLRKGVASAAAFGNFTAGGSF